MWGNGEQKRELVHVTDFVNQMLLLEDKINNDIVNLGAGDEYSIKHFAKLICEITGYDHDKIFYNETKYVGALSKNLDINKKKKLLPDYKEISLEEGLRETILDIEKKIDE